MKARSGNSRAPKAEVAPIMQMGLGSIWPNASTSNGRGLGGAGSVGPTGVPPVDAAQRGIAR